MKEVIKKAYYHLTAYLPRKLPSSEAEFLAFRDVLLNYYSLKDEPQTYVVIAGQIQSTPGHKLRKSYGTIANHVKRVKINAIAQCYKVAANQQMEYKLSELMKKEADRVASEVVANEPVSDTGIQESTNSVV